MFYFSVRAVIFYFFLFIYVEGKFKYVGCRDNYNEYVNWWVMFKPPAGEGADGKNFAFVAERTKYDELWPRLRRWQGLMDITSENMMHFTLDPLYKKSLAGRIATLVFEENVNSPNGSEARGVLLADESGGLYFGHTVPFLVDVKLDKPRIPASEMKYGHMMICVNMDLETLNNLGVHLKLAAPKVVELIMPNSLLSRLPSWTYVGVDIISLRTPPPSLMEFTVGSMNGTVLARTSTQRHCLYRSLAKDRDLILDVYSHEKMKRDTCRKDHGIRTIASISLKLSGEDSYVQYLRSSTDRIRFAVSTASVWQRRIPGPEQYWACFGSVDRDATNGGLLVCLHNYMLWNSMDTLKVKEPVCPGS